MERAGAAVGVAHARGGRATLKKVVRVLVTSVTKMPPLYGYEKGETTDGPAVRSVCSVRAVRSEGRAGAWDGKIPRRF
jgi:hypothetical protein